MIEAPASITYSSVVSRDSVRLAFLFAALNDLLEIIACDLGNAYLNAPCRENVWFVAGPEFGSRQGPVVKVVTVLYARKSSGTAWREMFNTTVLEMRFSPTIANPDMYCRTNANVNGLKYHEYLLVYVDDVLIISHDPSCHLESIQAQYELNPSRIGPPNRYLGADMKRVTRPSDPSGSFSANTYVKTAVRNVNLLLQAEGRNLKSTAKSPFSNTAYRPETDTTDKCDTGMASWYAQLIGVLRWAVELGRIDIYTEASLLSQHLALPQV